MQDEDTSKSGLGRRLLYYGGSVTGVVLLVLLAIWNRNPTGSKPLTGPETPSDPPAIVLDPDNPTGDPPAPPDRVAVLRGVKVGTFVSGWRVMSMTITSKPEVKGALAVMFRKGPKTFALWIAPKGQLNTPAPFETERQAIYSGHFVETDWLETATPVEEVVAHIRYVEAEPTAAPSAIPQNP